MKRTDIHRPSAIQPEDYEYVAEEYIPVHNLGDALCLKAQRDIIDAHRKRTGATYSNHEHGGNCAVCGNVNAIYTSLFWHRPSNKYVRMGHDCADKCNCAGEFARKAFRRAVDDVREALAGKRKAEALLSDWGMQKAWEIYIAEYETLVVDGRMPYEETTIRDIVGKLVKYGSITQKTQDYIGILLNRIPGREQREAERKAKHEAEREAAADCPTGRIVIDGEVLGLKVVESIYGTSTKMLVRDDKGFKVFGSRIDNAQKGERVKFNATVNRSDKDSKFGFFSRPTLYVSPEEKKRLAVERKAERERKAEEEEALRAANPNFFNAYHPDFGKDMREHVAA